MQTLLSMPYKENLSTLLAVAMVRLSIHRHSVLTNLKGKRAIGADAR